MSERLAVLDTNVLGVSASLNSPLWVSLGRLCTEASITLCLPEIVLAESLNLRRDEYQKAQREYLDAYKKIGPFFELPAVYVPDVEEVVEKWGDDLKQMFRILATEPLDASEALSREAMRQKPAKGGRGARDSLIWLTCRRLAAAGAEVFFVSRNTNDFADADSQALHPDLAGEIDGITGILRYLPSLDALFEQLAERTEGPDLSDTEPLELLLGFPLWDFAIDEMDVAQMEDSMVRMDWGFSGLRTLRAYRIGDRGLALVDGVCRVAGTHQTSGWWLPVKFMAWIGFDLDTKIPVEGEIVTMSAVRP